MKILVLSCDKNTDTFKGFHHCIEKHWKNHPEVIYATETINNPYYKTICKNYPLDKWSVRIRETLNEIDDEHILVCIDDCFIRQDVDTEYIEYLDTILKDNIANINFEKTFDKTDYKSEYKGLLRRKKGSQYEVSIQFGLWSKKAFIDILDGEYNPWDIEYNQKSKDYEYLIGEEYIIDWGYRTWNQVGKAKGVWVQETIDYLKSEGIDVYEIINNNSIL